METALGLSFMGQIICFIFFNGKKKKRELSLDFFFPSGSNAQRILTASSPSAWRGDPVPSVFEKFQWLQLALN